MSAAILAAPLPFNRMSDFLEILIGLILDVLGEALLEIVSGFLVSLIGRAVPKATATPYRQDRFFTFCLFSILGAAAGLVSFALFPHPLVRPSRFHGISMAVSPVITGTAMFAIGRIELRFGRKSTQIESFWIGFVFALAMAIVRFLLVR
jgi:tetrahydromethanopterin S-methyltransferase subunit F